MMRHWCGRSFICFLTMQRHRSGPRRTKRMLSCGPRFLVSPRSKKNSQPRAGGELNNRTNVSYQACLSTVPSNVVTHNSEALKSSDGPRSEEHTSELQSRFD